MRHKRFTIGLLILTGLLLGMATLPAAAQGAWYAEYFANRDLAGAPAVTRYENSLNFDWKSGSPGSGIPADSFSARFTRDEWFEAGTYRFSYRSDDGVRLWVGNTLVVDDWRDRQAVWTSVDHFIPKGTQQVRVEYYENGGGAALQVGWQRVSGGATWRAEYFNNRDLSGSPALVRFDPAIDFDWGTGKPDAAVSADNFSARWTRTLGFTPGAYRFFASTDDGVRIYVDGRVVVDAWRDQTRFITHSGDITLGSGQHTVVVEYYEHGDRASAHVWWNLQGTFSGWEGRYYDNPDLRGGPALIRNDAAIDFNWGEGAPAEWMPADQFSAVWTQNVTFSPGFYRLYVQSDDGVRVWLDNALIMDFWQPMNDERHQYDGAYLQGSHALKVEYFERAGLARIRFWWEPMSTATPSAAPTSAPAPLPGLPGPWQAEYYNNTAPSGIAALARTDAVINFNWGWNAPAAEINRDNFSARWTGTFVFTAGRYRFTTFSDDGVRLYVDGKLIVDSWRPMRGTRSVLVNLSEGPHTVRLEYFERTGVAQVRLNWSR